MINTPKILIIDDIKDNIFVIKTLVKKNFPTSIVLTAINGDLGIELAKSTIPDLILLDILMPIKDGYLVCEELKKNKETQEIPVIFVTALSGDAALKIKALNVGAEGFLTKPIDEPTLIATISAMLKIREADIYRSNENKRLEEQVYLKTINLNKELSERKKSEIKLRESENRYIGLIDNLDSGVVVYDENAMIISKNKRAVEIFSISSKEAYDTDLSWTFIDINAIELEEDEIPANIILRTNEPFKNHIIGITSDNNNQKKWLKCNGFPRFDTDENLIEIVISFVDITLEIINEKKEKSYLS